MVEIDETELLEKYGGNKVTIEWTLWAKILFYINCGIAFFSVLVGMDQPCFLSLILSLTYIFWWVLKDNNGMLFK